jgi:hypothetical protein
MSADSSNDAKDGKHVKIRYMENHTGDQSYEAVHHG